MTAGDMDIKIKILLAAKKLFAQNGFEKTTIRQICEEAGANIALVSYHFGGKENMFGEIFEQFFPNDKLAKVDQTLDPVSGVELIIRQVTIFRFEDRELVNIIQQEIIMNTPRINKIRKHVMPMWKLLRSWLEQGRERGHFQFRTLDTTLMSIIGILLFYKHSEYWEVLIEDGKPKLEEMIEDLNEFIMNGLKLTR